MTNKQEKYYVVSETHLEELVDAVTAAARTVGKLQQAAKKDLIVACRECRARPAPEWATHFYWETEERNGLGVPIAQTEEIKR